MLSAAGAKIWDSEEISRVLGISQENFWEATGGVGSITIEN